MSDNEQSLFDDVKVVAIEDEMKTSYLDYAMSVIVSRALPDARDGLKPVHRRLLFAMQRAGNDYSKPHRKCAKIVGEVMGNYHPHGDVSLYESLVRLAQPFNMRLPLVCSKGNFGSMDGDPPAAQRYTEARLSKSAEELLKDIDRDTVDFQPNYDSTLTEPIVLPARFPNLLVNGSNGIAVGMATYVPSHNLGEVIDACCALVDEPNLSAEELMQYIQGPDFPTGGIIIGRGGILQAYKTGRGSTIIRSKTHIEEIRGGREAIIITEVPYQVNKAKMVEKIAEMVKEKIIEDISNIRDESNRKGVRVVIELKKDAVADVVLNKLYKFSPVQGSVNFNMLALVYGRPEQMSLRRILDEFIAFRAEVVTRRCRFELRKARERAHILMGFAVALANLDEIIDMIKSSADRASARQGLLAKKWPARDIGPLFALVDDSNDPESAFYELSPTQADAILDLRLHRLTGLERQKINDELHELSRTIADLLDILGSHSRIMSIVKQEMLDVKEKFNTPRRTVISGSSDAVIDDEDIIQREDMVVTVSMEGYIKRVPLATYRSQKRGGRGRSGMTTKEEDVVSDVIVANTHDNILFFSSLGQVYSLKVYQLPIGTPQSRGRAMVNLFPLSDQEKISTVFVINKQNFDDNGNFLIFVTSFGNVRRNRISDFEHIGVNGKRAMRLDSGESLIGVKMARADDDIFIVTHKGMANRFSVENVRLFAGRDSNGVRGIKLAAGDSVINVSILSSQSISSEERDAYYLAFRAAEKEHGGVGDEAEEGSDIFTAGNRDEVAVAGDERAADGAGDGQAEDGAEADDQATSEVTLQGEVLQLSDERVRELAESEQFILTITEKGFGKRTSAYAYRSTNRGTKGVANIVVNNRNGSVVSSFPVCENDDIILITDNGRLMRCPVRDIRITNRVVQGVIVFRVDKGEKVVAVSCVPAEEVEE
ncbi:MAG: DNA gyrase subunit A [Holosporales bacterium]|jgi:DNA gyrase subunit A|nr:DNA gyrase subunit A [Holosporales bacterium]